MKLNRLQWDCLIEAVQRIGVEYDGINIYTTNDRYNKPEEEAIQFGVNWCACGTQTAQNTLDFSKKLMEAATIAQVLNNMGVTYTFDEPELQLDEDTFRQYCKGIMEMLRLNMADMVVTILSKMA